MNENDYVAEPFADDVLASDDEVANGLDDVNVFANLPPVKRRRYGEKKEDYSNIATSTRILRSNPKTPNGFEDSGGSFLGSSHTASVQGKRRWTDAETTCLAKAIKKLYNGLLTIHQIQASLIQSCRR